MSNSTSIGAATTAAPASAPAGTSPPPNSSVPGGPTHAAYVPPVTRGSTARTPADSGDSSDGGLSRTLVIGAALAAGALIVVQLPEIRRYLRMRSM